jgi:hypothetical protein
MARFAKTLAAASIATVCTATSATIGLASAFVAWRVADVSSDDVLMVRAYPSASSRILVGYPDGVTLSMTGRCTDDVRLDEIQDYDADEQRELVSDAWCEVWLDPHGTGEFRTGWVFGRYIAPDSY